MHLVDYWAVFARIVSTANQSMYAIYPKDALQMLVNVGITDMECVGAYMAVKTNGTILG